ADRLLLDLRRRAGVHRQVDVVGVREQVRHRPDLEAARTHADEVPGARLRDRLIQDPRGVVERFVRGRRVLGELGAQELEDALVERGLLGTEVVEALPGLGDELRRVLEQLLPGGVEPQRPVGFAHTSDATSGVSRTSEPWRNAPTYTPISTR